MISAAQKAPRHRGTGAARRGRLAVLWLAAGAGALAVSASGCGDVPTSGSVQQGTAAQASVGQAQDLPQLIPVPPGAGWSYVQIVDGFLAASASFTSDHAVAREYLTPSEAKNWRPGWAATVVSSAPNVHLDTLRNNPLTPDSQAASVSITGQSLATLKSSGQYLPARGAQRNLPPFNLEKVNGQWRINQLPSPTSLILTQPAFQRDYVPRNLYYFGPNGALVPDPVFVPQQDTSEEPATGMVNALRQDPVGWLAGGAISSSFPPGTRLIGVSITATSAVVDLGGSAAKASRQVLDSMAAQIVWTLTSSSYSPSAISSVQIKINQKPVTPLLLQQNYNGGSLMPVIPAGRVYYIDKSGRVGVLSGSAQPARVLWPTRAPVTKIAVAPDNDEIAGIVPQHDGCTVYAGQPQRGAVIMARHLSGGTCTSLSFDKQGDIWAAAGPRVWFLPEDGAAALPVSTPGVPISDTITALRVAPDGVRIAMIARGSTGSGKVLLGAITPSGTPSGVGPQAQLNIGQNGLQTIGAGIADPTALSWDDADHILVLSGRRNGQLYSVPLDGGAAGPIATPGGAVSVATAGPGGHVFVGTSAGKIMMSLSQGSWRQVAEGTVPVYPG
jgi:hypothetical protein